MKRSLVFVPIVLLILLNACSDNGDRGGGDIPDSSWTAIAMIAASWTSTPTPVPTPKPDGQWLITTLNTVGPDYAGSLDWDKRGGLINDAGLAVNLDALEDYIGADFIITGVDFPFLADKVSRAFLIRARCQCAVSSDCCSPQHMFVLTIRRLYLAMQKNQQYQQYQPYPENSYLTTAVVPAPIQELWVECYDHKEKMATMIAPWSAVLDFYHGQINGYQLGEQVRRQ